MRSQSTLPDATQVFPSQVDNRLESARSKWQYGEWQDLIQLRQADIEGDPERGKLAILVAAAHSHSGDVGQARQFVQLACDWGCKRQIIARVLISATHNSLARCAISLREEMEAAAHFEEAIRLVEPRADIHLLGRTRQIRETARMGFLPDALLALEQDLHSLDTGSDDRTPQFSILKSEIDLLKHELMISLKRGQLYKNNSNAHKSDTALESRAVSQLGQDLWVLEQTGYKHGGFFVEFGASDGITLSNTWLLETEFDWSGICAEPNPKFFEILKQNRSCVISGACIGARTGEKVDFILADVFGGIVDYISVDMHGKTRAAYKAAGEVLQVTTISLEDFLLSHDAPREIDYLSIDTEGSEYDILAAFPFDRWTIRFITVEHNFTSTRDKIYALLESHGYERTSAQWDDWYELKGDAGD